MPFLTINSINYHFKIWGSGEPTLLLHGFTGSSENWKPIAARLAADYQVVAIDLLGHGQTEAPADPERYQMSFATADIDAFLDQLGLDRVHVVGYSMGGRIALSFALRCPTRVNSLVLESASPGLRTPKERAERIERDNVLANKIEREGIPAFVTFWEELALWESQKEVDVTKRIDLRQLRLKNRPLGLANSLRGMGTGRQPSNWESLHTLSVPTQLLTGQLDQKFCKIGAEMASHLSNGSLYMIPSVGHTIHFEVPDKYTAILQRWLSSSAFI